VCAVVLKPGDVIQHGDAQVCRDARCVVPVLEVSGQSFRSQASRTSMLACPQPAQPRQLFELALEQFGCSAAELFLAGYAVPLCQMGFAVTTLLEIGASPGNLRKAGYQTKSMLEVFTSAELLKLGYPASELKEAGCSAVDLHTAGYTTAQLQEAFPAKSMLEVVTSAELLKLGYPASALKEDGFSAFDLHNAGYTTAQLQKAFPAMAVIFMDQVMTDGFPIRHHLKGAAEACYPAVRLRQIGCRAAELEAAGYRWEELFQAGFGDEELLHAGAQMWHFTKWRPNKVKIRY